MTGPLNEHGHMASQSGPASGQLNVSSPPKGRGFHVRFSERALRSPLMQCDRPSDRPSIVGTSALSRWTLALADQLLAATQSRQWSFQPIVIEDIFIAQLNTQKLLQTWFWKIEWKNNGRIYTDTADRRGRFIKILICRVPLWMCHSPIRIVEIQ